MGMNVLIFDPTPNKECIALGVNYVSIDQLFTESDVISIHCPLNEKKIFNR
jgi:D-lactate dehydrogenase